MEGIVSFVLSGGVGARLWPLSRADNPKQFHDLTGSGSLLAETVARLHARPGGPGPVHLIASRHHAARVDGCTRLVSLAGGRVIFEPVARNTAAAVAVASLTALRDHGDRLVLVVPSDHAISTSAAFWESIGEGIAAARAGAIVLFGVKPHRLEPDYGHIEVETVGGDGVLPVRRFVEKPDVEAARAILAAGNHYWNTGIFLFRAETMRAAFAAAAPEIWAGAARALATATIDGSGTCLGAEAYAAIPAISIDHAIIEKARPVRMVPARFEWSDLGSWRSLLDAGQCDASGNVVVGDVVAIDCRDSYLRSEGRLLAAVGLTGQAVVATADATFVAPVSESRNVRKVVAHLERTGRLETRFTPASDTMPVTGSWRERAACWLFGEALPLWSENGVDRRHGGFHEALALDGTPLARPKRTRTMARQLYAFALAKGRGWNGPADDLIAHGLGFLVERGRTPRGGYMRALHADGTVLDATEDTYDHAFVLLALAHAHSAGHPDALRLGAEAFAFLDEHLADPRTGGFLDRAGGGGMRRSNPHMHLLEAFLAWAAMTGDPDHVARATAVAELFTNHFFDADNWALGEFFDDDWRPRSGALGQWTEPGHHFEWAALLTDYAALTGRREFLAYARKLYASAIANGLNRATGLAYGAVTREGMPLSTSSRSWPQSEAVKAAIALDGTDGPDMKPEIEARMGRLFRWHINPAPRGLWIDEIDRDGRCRSRDAPASIFYHLASAVCRYLDATEAAAQNGLSTSPVST